MKGIYTITNLVNNKIYVGYAVNLITRENTHFTTLRLGYHDNSHLQRAYIKYGKENFKFELIEECEERLLCALEHYWATILNVHNRNFGYNIRPTSPECYCGHSLETRRKLSIINKGKIFSKESIEKMKLTKKLNPRIYTEQDSKFHIKNQREKIGKKILIFNLDGSLFGSWNSITEGAISLKVNPSVLAAKTIENKSKINNFGRVQDYIPIKEKDYKKDIEYKLDRKQRDNKKVKVINIDTGQELIFNSMSSVKKSLNIWHSTIREAIEKRNSTYKNYKFEYI